jgi:hypothetical protein
MTTGDVVLMQKNKGKQVILVSDGFGRQSHSVVGNLSECHGARAASWHVDSIGMSSVFSDEDVESVSFPRSDEDEKGIRLVIRLHGPGHYKPVPKSPTWFRSFLNGAGLRLD